ncbi:hypothetical protein [Rathayibacter sp. AY1A3]|uniref:hypothetical protein n=1 Tax=Rathayibacter sp. AY1A3 TaxID=2080521 RepID=UPI0011B019CA|nr:hypothetical protein [Rathayibacter sp. AY1A3]
MSPPGCAEGRRVAPSQAETAARALGLVPEREQSDASGAGVLAVAFVAERGDLPPLVVESMDGLLALVSGLRP